MRQLVVFLAAVWGLLGVAVFSAEPLSRESAKEFLERLRAAKAEFEKSSPKGNGVAGFQKGDGVAGTEDTLNRATVFIGDSHSKGSGFFTKLWGEPVILTSAQVIALMQNPGLMNINSESFKVRAILVHKNLDLAILEPEPGSVPKDMPFLKIDPKLILKDIGSTTEEYCDINGNRKLGKREGKLLGFEKDKIEIEYTVDPGKNDPPILAANSGGPILNKEGNVIGMTAYFREPSMREIFSETRLFHLTETGKVEGEGAEEQAEKWEEKRKTGEIRFDNWRDGWSYYIPTYKTIYKYRYKVPRIEPIDLEGFELFDKASQEKDLAFYEKYEKIVRQCVNEVRDPHYNWTVYWPWNQQKPITDLSNISNYLYCYEHFHKMDWTTYFNYRASLSTLQHHLNFQQGVFAELACLVHVNLLRLQETEISSAERIVKQLNKDRKGYFICPQCGGAKVIHISKLTGTITRDCPYCERAGRFTVPFYGPWRLSPLRPFPQSKWEIFKFRLGMSMSEANKVANETWRSDAEQYNIIDLNGIFDCVRVGRNPVENLDERNRDKRILSAERILSTELKFLARRLLSIAVTFEHDQHNLPTLKQWVCGKFGPPNFSREVPGEWGFLMFVKDDITVTLSFSSSKIVLRAYHRILQHAEYMVLNSLEQQIFSPPLKFVGADGFLKLDHGSYAKTLNFFP